MRVVLFALVLLLLACTGAYAQAPDGLVPVPEPTVTVEGQFVPYTPEPTAVGGTVPFPPVPPVRPTPNMTPVPIDPTFYRPHLLFLPMVEAEKWPTW
jgi:hypothetical protein